MVNATLFKEKQKSDVQLCVIVPVKNEASDLINTLDALCNQKSLNNNPLDQRLYEVLLLANNCTDNSHQLAAEYQKKHPDFNIHIADIQLPEEVAHIGTVRRMLMDEAYDRFLNNKNPKGIIASTDGDSEVDSLWVYSIISAMSKGIDVVGGRIISKNTPIISRLYHLQDVTYRYYVSRLEAMINPCVHDPWPRHFQCYGASTAVTCDAYDRAGRLPVLPFLEDEEFRKSLYRIDAKVRMCPNVKVYTSSRLVGKVRFGFSVQLQQWAQMKSGGKAMEVETLGSLAEMFEIKHLLKQYWQQPPLFHRQGVDLSQIAKRLHISADWLKKSFETNKYFGAFWEQAEQLIADSGDWRKLYPLAPIEEVIYALRQYFYSNQNIRTSQTKFKDIA